MCGFAGFVGEAYGSGNPEALLSSMANAIAHRGPDGQGIFSAPGLGLAHVRLSIVGLSDGQQPMTDADGRFTIVFNGEIFNYVELRDEPEGTRHHFPHRQRYGSPTAALCDLWRGLPLAPQRRLRLRDLGSPRAPADARPRPDGRQTALLHGTQGFAVFRLGGQGAAPGAWHRRRTRSGGARPDFHPLGADCAAHRVQGHFRTRTRPPDDRPERPDRNSALLGAGFPGCRRPGGNRPGGDGRGTAGIVDRRDAAADARRRAGRRLSLRRARPR